MVYFLVYSSIFSPLIPILLIGINANKIKETTYKLFALFTLISFFADLATITIITGNNYLFLNAYGLLEFFLLGIIFIRSIQSRYHVNLIVFSLSILSYLILFLRDPFQFNDVGKAIEACYAILYSIIYFYSVFQNADDIHIEKNPHFWFVVGLFVYFSGSLFSFLLSNEILKQTVINSDYSWAFHNMSNIGKNLVFALGFRLIRNNS